MERNLDDIQGSEFIEEVDDANLEPSDDDGQENIPDLDLGEPAPLG